MSLCFRMVHVSSAHPWVNSGGEFMMFLQCKQIKSHDQTMAQESDNIQSWNSKTSHKNILHEPLFSLKHEEPKRSWLQKQHLKGHPIICQPCVGIHLHFLNVCTWCFLWQIQKRTGGQTHFRVGTILCWDFISLSRYHRHLPCTLRRLFRRSCSAKTIRE